MNESSELSGIIERFEEAWEGSQPPSVAGFAAKVAPGSSSQRELLLELVAVDLEHRWRRFNAEEVETVTHNVDSTGKPQDLPSRPTLEDYVAHLPDLGSIAKLPLELIVDEFRARHHFGDRPPIKGYLVRFPHLAAQLEPAIREVLAESAPVSLKVFCDKQAVYSTRLDKPVEIGRQCPDEPLPYCEFDTDAGKRLLIAPLEETCVSRRHVHVERIQAGKVRVTSRTTRGDIGIGADRLSPGASVDAELPVLLVLGRHAIRLESLA